MQNIIHTHTLTNETKVNTATTVETNEPTMKVEQQSTKINYINKINILRSEISLAIHMKKKNKV